jgi:predicted O-methyltransferase YrrM
LTHPESHITCVDNFSSSTTRRVRGTFQKDIKKTFLNNTSRYKRDRKLTLIEANTRDALKLPSVLSQKFDFVYIDAGRHAKNVLEDAILSFALLNEGGLIVFDDYTTSKKHDYTCPKKGIDAFLDMYSDELKVINTSWQVIAKKVKPNRLQRPCSSELFT